MEKNIGDIMSMLCKEFVNLSKQQRNISKELREVKKEITIMKEKWERAEAPCKIVSMSTLSFKDLSGKRNNKG